MISIVVESQKLTELSARADPQRDPTGARVPAGAGT
jgi:hypothetical protein